jgi:hypothetical protein
MTHGHSRTGEARYAFNSSVGYHPDHDPLNVVSAAIIAPSMSDLHIRPASIADAATLAELIGALGYPTTPTEMRERLAALTTRLDSVTPVASQDDRIVGLAGALVYLAIEHIARSHV